MFSSCDCEWPEPRGSIGCRSCSGATIHAPHAGVVNYKLRRGRCGAAADAVASRRPNSAIRHCATAFFGTMDRLCTRGNCYRYKAVCSTSAQRWFYVVHAVFLRIYHRYHILCARVMQLTDCRTHAHGYGRSAYDVSMRASAQRVYSCFIRHATYAAVAARATLVYNIHDNADSGYFFIPIETGFSCVLKMLVAFQDIQLQIT